MTCHIQGDLLNNGNAGIAQFCLRIVHCYTKFDWYLPVSSKVISHFKVFMNTWHHHFDIELLTGIKIGIMFSILKISELNSVLVYRYDFMIYCNFLVYHTKTYNMAILSTLLDYNTKSWIWLKFLPKGFEIIMHQFTIMNNIFDLLYSDFLCYLHWWIFLPDRQGYKVGIPIISL